MQFVFDSSCWLTKRASNTTYSQKTVIHEGKTEDWFGITESPSEVKVAQSCLTLCDPSWISPGQNTGVGSLSLLQGIFPTQGLNPSLPHCRQTLYHLSHQGSPISVTTMENIVEFPQKIKNRTILWSSNCTSGYLPKENENTDSKRYMHTPCSMQHYLGEPRLGMLRLMGSQSRTRLSDWTELNWRSRNKLSRHRWINRQWNTSQPKNKILQFVIKYMDPEGIMLTKISQTEKDKYHMISLICGM